MLWCNLLHQHVRSVAYFGDRTAETECCTTGSEESPQPSRLSLGLQHCMDPQKSVHHLDSPTGPAWTAQTMSLKLWDC